MNKTKIEWCDYTWNPVTGCLYNCGYCYASEIAHRFSTCENNATDVPESIHEIDTSYGTIVELDEKLPGEQYPYDFVPTFHRYRLNEPQKIKTPQNVFVCSMADLFGDWVPDEWIGAVFRACEAAPQHRYLFLTKNPKRYNKLAESGKLPPQHWYGFTHVAESDTEEWLPSNFNMFVSIEPLLARPNLHFLNWDSIRWVIVGAETGNRKGKITPDGDWLEEIYDLCKQIRIPLFPVIPLFFKNSLKKIWGETLPREYPHKTITI